MKTKSAKSLYAKLNISLLVVSGAVLVAGGFLPSVRQAVLADSYQDQIDSLSAENSRSQAAIASLRGQATSYQDVIASLQSQINTLQTSINANQAQQASLQQQITDDQNHRLC